MLTLCAALLIAPRLLAQSAEPARSNFKVVYSFTGTKDGGLPETQLVLDKFGNAYGSTAAGGNPGCLYDLGCGTVFKVSPTGKETVLHRFTGGTDGAGPYYTAMIRDAEGNLYGNTFYGGNPTCNYEGAVGCGVIFKLDRHGRYTVLHSFTGGKDGADPEAGMVLDSVGNLYGTTYLGGSGSCNGSGCGVVFKLDRNGHETVLYRFTGSTDGAFPADTTLIRDSAGNIFGTTYGPVNSNYGTVFKLDTTGRETTLHAFSGGADGRYPTGLIRDVSGKLYGTTLEGGRFGYGTVFVLDQTGRETVLYSFHGKGDGFYPLGDLVQDQVGNLYGVTRYGGDLPCNTVGCGTVFKISRNLGVTVLHKFVKSDGVGPVVGLMPDKKGHLWGVANNGGTAGGGGTVFEVTY